MADNSSTETTNALISPFLPVKPYLHSDIIAFLAMAFNMLTGNNQYFNLEYTAT